MNIKTNDGAKELNITVIELFQYLFMLNKKIEYSQIWPEVENELIETIKVMNFSNQRKKNEEIVEEEKNMVCIISENSKIVLDKLSRHDNWGKSSVPFEALINIVHLSKKEVEAVIEELRNNQLLDKDGTENNPISLHSGKRKQIERIINNK